ncbi:MAG: alpha-2-macroglobulin family protein [Firmicutes bacterium]|nr:alpha-2-macroglobulin family protein [Bacillota bacterium]
MGQNLKQTTGWTKIWQNKKRLIFYAGGFLLLALVAINLYFLFYKPGITLISVNPSGEISPKTKLTFTFSGGLAPAEIIGQTFGGDLIKFTPPVPGKYRWISPRELQFLPEAPFRPSARYKLELRPDLSPDKSKWLSGNRTREFTTHRFRINEAGISFIYLANQKKGIELQARLNFNYPVAPAELQKALKLHFVGLGREIKYNLSPREVSSQFTLASEPLFLTEKEQKVELNIAKGLRPDGGDLGLQDDFVKKLVLGVKQELKILGVAAKTDSSNCWLSVHCSEPVEPQTVSNFIELQPAAKFKTEVDGAYILIRSEAFKADESYNLRIAAGLPALNGLPLKREYSASGVFASLEPSLRFNSTGKYLSSKGFMNLGLETVNIDKVNLEISQIFPNNLVSFLNNLNNQGYISNYYIPEYGRVIQSEVFTVGGAENETVTTPINLGKYFTDKYRGVFQVTARDNEDRWRDDNKYVVVTDLGILAKMGQNELDVWVNSLESLEPKRDTKVSLLSRNNQVIATATTDNKGMARFPELQKRLGDFQPFLILAEQEKDFSFITFNDSLISTTDFDVNGRNSTDSGYEAFLYLDRDIFRPGDHGNLVGVIRGAQVMMPPEFPVKLMIKQPDGQIFKELLGVTGGRGLCEFGFEIPDYAQTGKYSASLLVAEEVTGSATFWVEDFMPERIKVTTKTDKNEYNPGEEATISVEGVTLFGPPASGRRAEMRVKIEPEPFRPAGYQSYVFGDPELKFTNIDEELGGNQLDDKGMTKYTYAFPENLTPPARLKATFQGTVFEEGGRAVSSYKVVSLHPYPVYIGMKPLTEEYGEVGKPYPVKYVVLDQQGNPAPKRSLKVEVYRITWNSVWRRDSDGRYTYHSVEEKIRVYTGPLPGAAGEQTYEFTPIDWGRYQIVITDAKSGSRGSFGFYASGFGYAPWAMESPEKIQLDLEKKSYKVGARARLQVKAPFSGKALITVERGKVYDYQVVVFKNNTGTVTIPVKEEYKPNVYLSVHLIRPVKSLEKNTPVRAYGAIPLMVDCSQHNLPVQLEAPAEVRPNRTVEVQVKVANTGGQAYLTLAAVDEGICQITNYSTPDPLGFFYGKRALNIYSYDLYGMILPEVAPVENKKSPGGDADEQNLIRRQNLNPVSVCRVKPVSLWSGLVKLNRGAATIKLKTPQFNGTLRLMAVACSGANFGSSQKKILVRDPIVITPSFPRFVAPGDQFTLPVSLFNGTGSAGDFTLNIASEGPVEFIGKNKTVVELQDQEEKTVRFQLKAKNASGKLAFKLMVKGNQAACEMSEELAVRPAGPLTHEIVSGVITAKTPLKITLEDKWMPGTTDYRLTLSPFPGIKLAGSLQYLLGYPYGCLEQTASKIFPLLYFKELAEATDTTVFKGGNAGYYVNQGIEKLESMQMWDGSFSCWPGGNYSNDWSSIYASHCLIEARKAGFNVPDRVYERLISNLTRISKSDVKDEYHFQTKVYALYALSLAGKPQTSVMSYLKNYRLDQLTLYSRAQLAACYFYAGDRNTSVSLLPESFAVYTGNRETGGNFNSQVRADAIILGVLAEVDPMNPAVPKLVKRISDQAETGYWGTTQENAFALMALGKVLKRSNQESYSGELIVGKTRIASFDNSKAVNISGKRLAQGPVTVKLTGGGVCYYYLKISGIALTPEVKEYDNGIHARRRFLDRYGNALDLGQVKQGDLLIAEITIASSQGGLENVAVVDLLPGGFEIENPRLGKDSTFNWMVEKDRLQPDYMDIRDDRLLLFTGLPARKDYARPRVFYYAVRAVTCGEFTLPPLKAECMYEPEISSISSSGRVVIQRN